MSSPVRQRIVGAIVIIALLAIFIPVFFTSHHKESIVSDSPPAPPPLPVVNLKIPPMPKQTSQAAPIVSANQSDLPAQDASHATSSNALAPVVDAKATPVPVASMSKLNNKPQGWRLQLGTFSNQKNSRHLIEKLNKAGFEAYAVSIKGAHGKAMQQVYIGPTMSEVEAKQLQQHLSEKMHMPSMIKPC